MHALIAKTVTEQIVEDRIATASRVRAASRLRRAFARRERRGAPPSSVAPGRLRVSRAAP